MNMRQLRELIVAPTLTSMAYHTGQPGWASDAAIELVMATGYTESRYEAVRQYARRDGRRGPARGMWQCEPRTHRDYWRWLEKKDLITAVEATVGMDSPDLDALVFDLRYQCLMARVHYRRIRAPLPVDQRSMALYWKKYYNSHLGAGTVEGFMRDHRRMRSLEKRQLL